MGGLVIRSALLIVQRNTPGWPPYLYVEDVITLATPHKGPKTPGPAAAAWAVVTEAAGHGDGGLTSVGTHPNHQPWPGPGHLRGQTSTMPRVCHARPPATNISSGGVDPAGENGDADLHLDREALHTRPLVRHQTGPRPAGRPQLDACPVRAAYTAVRVEYGQRRASDNP
jgi:hypothetical protein